MYIDINTEIQIVFARLINTYIYVYIYIKICWKIPIGNGSVDGQNLADQWVFFSHPGDPGGRILFINSMK